MRYINPFFKKNNKINLRDILKILNIRNLKFKNIKVNDIKDLDQASKYDITFLNSVKYIDIANKTKSHIIITNNKCKSLIKNKCTLVVVDNVS